MAALIVVPGAPEPRLADTGALKVRAPDVTANVTVVLGSLADACGAETPITPAATTTVAITDRIFMSPPQNVAGWLRANSD
jgi:hypothetical protein